jgi:hypothetical protein
MLSATHSPNDRLYRLLKFASIGLILLYLVNCLTPLRLHVDTIRYFGLKDCLESECPPGRAENDYLPFGYTAFLFILSKFGILKSFTIVLMNCIYLFASLYMLKKIFKDSLNAWVLFFFVLLNWCVIKHVVAPLSEIQFTFFSIASLYAFRVYSLERKWWQLVLSIALCILCILTRTAGIALFMALMFSLVWLYWKQLKDFIRTHKLLVGIGIASLVAVVFFADELGLTYYTSFVTSGAQQDLGTFIITNLKYHFEEVGQLVLNIPSNKVYNYISPGIGQSIFILVGVAALLLCGYLIFIRKNTIPFVVKAYLAFYCVLIFNWPFYDPRFFVPVVPVLIAALLQVPFRWKQPLKILGILYLAFYAVMGIIGAGYNTYTSLDKKKMARTHANGVYRNEYETVMFGKPLSDTAQRIDPIILDILKRHN